MMAWELFLGFLQVGCFTFGGAYSAIALIRDVVLSAGWLSEEALTHMIAVSESTPGPIMVNLATYVGSVQGGFWGAVLATLAVVLPSFVVILLIMRLMKNALKNPYVQAVLRGVKPCVVGVILATGASMTLRCCLPLTGDIPVDFRAVAIAAALVAASALPVRLRRKKLSPIALIVLSALLGMIIY